MPDKRTEILKRIGDTKELNKDDAKYIMNHYWDFKMPMFKRKKKISEKELDHIIEHYQDYIIPMFVRKKR